MQVNLKKSLYLGLAALTFASVAGASTASATTANAASHHVTKTTKKHAKKATKKHAKKAVKAVTFKVTKSLDQSLVYKSTGKNAIFTKPGGVKNNKLKVSKSDMGSKANSNSSNDLFMVYQEVRTSKGVHYYKVVSFDKKVRGYVYTKGVQKIDNPTTQAAKPSNTTGYVTTNNVYNLPAGYKFGADSSIKNFDGVNFSADKFTVDDAVTVYGGDTYYKVTDQTNPLINGWIKSSDFNVNMPDSVKNAQNTAQNAANAIHVTYVSNANLGSTVMTKSLNPASLQNNGTYNAKDVVNSVNDSLKGTGYNLINSSNITDKGSYLNDGSVVNKGENLTVVVTPQNNRQAVKYTVSQLQNPNSFNQSLAAISNSQLSPVNMSQNTYDSLFKGNDNDTFNYNNLKSQMLSYGQPMYQLTSNDAGHRYTYTFDANLTETNAANPKLFNANNQLISNATFSDVNSQSMSNGIDGLNLIYTVKDNQTGQQQTTPVNGSGIVTLFNK
ncbi:hypothetical protein DY120_00165 [Apilactobacillus micheneri]|uniref:S-layer protein n=1 Tax=Apilactobacillus micheneri TaxID=1899430 RepID=A0ABY2YYK7_9LACO|nr:hypothetical protein [Apilactobacillus micheneri]TPR26147.1 hypothetical protein DY114_00165 [Apilactobacillus micheneri]TPR26901.1 hypothetical protein DY111_00165 [Apilactobacillus micheneri]TPR27759.1 hypothetical protein DY113_03940 [Apilactobacillus micheneri]TPR31664.1 hypothetical protein DY117_00165 [Apilactobacillus micheneri]TPR32068.1 hypothetical protein DY120_00165 [Apilactobacillus micheneri]